MNVKEVRSQYRKTREPNSEKLECIHCSSSFINKISNLRRHLSTKHPNTTIGQNENRKILMKKDKQEKVFNEKFIERLAEISCESGRPLNHITTNGFKKLIDFLRTNTKVLFRATVMRCIDKLYEQETKNMLDNINKNDSPISLSLDFWTGSNGECIVASFIFINQEKKLLDFSEFEECTISNKNVHNYLKNILAINQIDVARIFGIVVDGASYFRNVASDFHKEDNLDISDVEESIKNLNLQESTKKRYKLFFL